MVEKTPEIIIKLMVEGWENKTSKIISKKKKKKGRASKTSGVMIRLLKVKQYISN